MTDMHIQARRARILSHPALPELREVEGKLKALKRGVGGRSAIRTLHIRAFFLEGCIMRDSLAPMAEVQQASGAL
jgi:hypothetical protein